MRRTTSKLNIRRGVALVLATLLLAVLLVSSLSVSTSAAESGTCGDKLTWSLSAGTLTINGTGAMTNFSEANPAPWYEYREQIRRISLPDGLKTIGILAFAGCSNLKTVYIPDSVTRIGKYAFSECTKLESLYIGNSVSNIGPAAFYNCKSLVAVRLPESLKILGYQAFYLCESLTAVTLPAGITDMGSSVFAYCKNLLRAEVTAELSSLPEWTFYGCERLTIVVLPETVSTLEDYAFKECSDLSTVYYSGSGANIQSIQNSLVADVPEFQNGGVISDHTPTQSVTAEHTIAEIDGTESKKTTTVSQSDNMTVIVATEQTHSMNTASSTSNVEIIVIVETKDAWEDAKYAITDALKSFNVSCMENNSYHGEVDVILYVKTEGGVDASLVEEMAGRDVKMTVVSQNGSESRIECEELKKEELSGSYDYSYNVEAAPSDKVESLGTEDCFQVKFNESASINSEILVQLPEVPAHSNAYLYQVEDDKTLTRLQATVVDDSGNAHFYLGAVNKDTEYVIGINVPGESSDDAIIPDEMLSHYGDAVERLQKIDYVITGRESSWGLSVAQVTWIMLGVLAVCIIAVGTVMAVWNHRRLKRGYVPDMAEYEDMDSDGSAGAEA